MRLWGRACVLLRRGSGVLAREGVRWLQVRVRSLEIVAKERLCLP
jgi:hypothetical protein